jgi:nickel-dependent lactate racemase
MFEVAYGKKNLSFDLLQGMEGLEAKPIIVSPLPSPDKALVTALKKPLDSPPLSALVRPQNRVCIVVPDTTRPFPIRELLAVILDYLTKCGLPDKQVEIAIAYGLHRPLTQEEKIKALGNDVVSRYRIVDHNATDRQNLVHLGKTTSGVPIVLHRTVATADVVLALGVVEPHQYAGYSGGAKTVAIGMAGAETIQATHSIAFLDHPDTGLDRLQDNPFSKALWEIASHVPLNFSVNITTDGEGRVTALSAGTPKAVYRDLVSHARQVMSIAIPQPVDIIIGGVGYPKDTNLYQASRAATYFAFATTPILKPNGVIIITAQAREGAGQGLGEQNFHRYFLKYPQLKTMMDQLRKDSFAPGAQRAYMLGKALMKHKIIVVGATCPDQVRELGMISASDMPEALDEGMKLIKTRPAKVLIVPHALQTLPKLIC